jgi:hypothetical protein
MRLLMFAIAAMLASYSGIAQVAVYDDHVDVVITNRMSQDEISVVIADAGSAGIAIEIVEIVLTEEGYVSSITGTVEFDSGQSGYFSSDDFNGLSISRHGDGTNTSIQVGGRMPNSRVTQD